MARERKNPHTKGSMITLVQAQIFDVNIDESHLNMTDRDALDIFSEAFDKKKQDENWRFNNDSILIAKKKLMKLCQKLSKHNKNAENLLPILQDKDIDFLREIGSGVRNFHTYGSVGSEVDDIISTFVPGCVFVGFAILVVYFIIHALNFEAPLTGPQIYCQRQGITC